MIAALVLCLFVSHSAVVLAAFCVGLFSGPAGGATAVASLRAIAESERGRVTSVQSLLSVLAAPAAIFGCAAGVQAFGLRAVGFVLVVSWFVLSVGAMWTAGMLDKEK